MTGFRMRRRWQFPNYENQFHQKIKRNNNISSISESLCWEKWDNICQSFGFLQITMQIERIVTLIYAAIVVILWYIDNFMYKEYDS